MLFGQPIGLRVKMVKDILKQLTDEEIKKSIEDYNYNDYNIYQVKKVHVDGMVAKIVFLKIKETAPIEHNFTATLEYYQEF